MVCDGKNVCWARDTPYTKRMPPTFFETPLARLLTFFKVHTAVITGGDPSGCVRAKAVEAISRGYRPITQSGPTPTCGSFHFANLRDMKITYSDVEPVSYVID